MLGRNRFHPKNIYKNPPNFKELAIQYPEFRKFVKQELSGRTTIDYQDQRAVRELTRTLLKKDFDLDVEINDSRLIPRVPLCLNYVLWIEDLLMALPSTGKIRGIDIGTGNVCIYALLCAKRGWDMMATEVDSESFKSAKNNISKNNLFSSICLKPVQNFNQLLLGVLDENTEYDFCMCNPPFFDYGEKPLNRTQRRPRIGTVASDIMTEVCTKGGEVLFIKKLIEESLSLKNKVKIYTTLVGKKSDFLHLKKELLKANPKSVAFTEFCQGRTMRWGLAWSFLDVSLQTKDKLKKQHKEKAKSALHYTLPSDDSKRPGHIMEDVKQVLQQLEIIFKEEVAENPALSFKVYKNTWSHQRRKKRLEARQKMLDDGKEEQTTQERFDQGASDAKRQKMSSGQDFSINTEIPIVEGFIILKSENESIVFEMTWLSGNKEYLHQIFQYFKNLWSKRT